MKSLSLAFLLSVFLVVFLAACGDWHIGDPSNPTGSGASSGGGSSSSAPATPAWINAVAINANAIEIDWATSPGATGYNLYGNNGALVAGNIAVNAVANTGLINNTEYCYQVNAENSAGTSAPTTPPFCVNTPAN